MGNLCSNTTTNATMSTVDEITADLKALYAEKECGPIMIRLSWHDAGVYSTGKLTGGCPNAAMRFTDGGEGCFGANAGECRNAGDRFEFGCNDCLPVHIL